ncbi:MAG TPA: hypothetical protein VFR21_28045 [Bradyrhizobium sp.]|nr:hypothetical protein [Bradyrhizobium sp.]
MDDIISHILVQLTITSPTHAREMQILHQISRTMPSLPFSQCAANSARKLRFAAENDNRADATDLICRSPDQPAFEAGIFHHAICKTARLHQMQPLVASDNQALWRHDAENVAQIL